MDGKVGRVALKNKERDSVLRHEREKIRWTFETLPIEGSIIAGSSFAGAIRLAASNYRSVIGAEFLLSLNLRATPLSSGPSRSLA